jgi:hypothetical protein
VYLRARVCVCERIAGAAVSNDDDDDDYEIDEESTHRVLVHSLVDLEDGSEEVLLRAQLHPGQLYSLYNIAVRFASFNTTSGTAVLTLPCTVKAPTIHLMATRAGDSSDAIKLSGGRCSDGAVFDDVLVAAITNPSVGCGAAPFSIAESHPAAGQEHAWCSTAPCRALPRLRCCCAAAVAT